MKSLAIITQYYKPEIGAPQNRLSEMAAGLKKCGWDIVVVTAMPNYPAGKIFAPYKRKFLISECIDDIEVRRHWLFPSNSKKSLPRILSMLSFSISVFFSLRYIFRKKLDFILVESPPLTLGISGLLISRICKTKFLLNVSDLWPLSAKVLGAVSDGFIYKRLEGLERFLYKQADITIGQSQQIVDYVKLHGAKKAYLFRNGVDPGRFIRERKATFGNKFCVVYTGLLGVAQGILNICRNINFREIGVEFHIYGDGSEREELENFLKIHPERGIIYHGFVAGNSIPQILQLYHATLISLVGEIFGAVPSKIYESMAAGLPILFSGDGEGRMIIDKFNLGWTSSSKDYNGLKDIILKFTSDPVEYEIKSANCLKVAKSEFNRPKQIIELDKQLTNFAGYG